MAKVTKKKSKDYFGLGWLISLILAIIPVTAWILGAFTRIKEKCYIAGIIRLIGVGYILWIIDIFCIAFNGKILRLLNI